MAGIKTLLGLYPKTSEFENRRNKLEQEFNALIEFESSDDLARFKELELYTNSEEFKLQKKELLTLRFNQSEEYKKESEFKKLRNDGELKLYFKTVNSALLANYTETGKSEKLQRFKELETILSSENFKKAKDYFKQSGKSRFMQSSTGKTLADYERQKGSDKIKGYFKFTGNKNFKDYASIAGSAKLIRYEELKKIIESSEFAAKKSSFKKAEFATSDEGKQLVEFKILAKSRDIKNYLNHVQSPYKKYYDELHASDELEAFNELEKFIHSSEFKIQRTEIEKKTFKDTDEFKSEQEFNVLKKDIKLKQFFSFATSKELSNYNLINESTKLERYNQLKEYLAGEAFNEKKKYLTMSPKTRWKQSEPFARQKEFEALQKSDKIVWFFKYKGHKKFDWFRTWQLSFDDDFDTGKLDRNKWLTRYFWGDQLLKESYSLADEKHCITDGKNLEFNGSILKIITRKEKAEGKIWDNELGFKPHEFEYTSGLINTGQSFKQHQGIFEAKIKVSAHTKILNAFWMVGESMLPHIDIINAQKNISMGLYNSENKFNKTLSKGRFSTDFYIYTIEWYANKIIWKINGLELATYKQTLPQEPFYLTLNSGLYEDVHDNIPGVMEIDWVRCYKQKN